MTVLHKHAKMFKSINLYPPLIGAGIKVKDTSDDMTSITVELKLTWWNRNVVGVQFGGSLYMMTDPFFMAILMMNLGKDYIVWDKSAEIEFLRPGKTNVTGHFHIPREEIDRIKAAADAGEKVLPFFSVDIVDTKGEIVARVKKGLYVRKKKALLAETAT